MKREDLEELHYIAPIENVPSILEHGILSHRRVAKLTHHSTAMDEIQKRRAKVTVPGGRSLHEYVNLYICARNPMMYKRQAGHRTLCILRVTPNVLDLPGVVVTDGNASSSYISFRSAPGGLKIVDQELAFARSWNDQNEIEKYRKATAKCAEVLVPDRVDPGYIVGAWVSCDEASQTLSSGLDWRPWSTQIFSSDEGAAMVKVLIGDLFTSKAHTLVNTVNTVGVMGKGVALEFKKRFPDMFEDYVRRCREGKVRLGRPYLFRRLMPPWILNFPTKDDWRSVTRLQDLIDGLTYLERHYKDSGIQSLAVPPLGCGQGQLEWRVVGPTLYRYLSRLDIPVELYAPFGTPHDELQPAYLADFGVTTQVSAPVRVNPAWVALVDILARIEREPHHRPIGRINFQKIAYFATRFGIPTGLDYRRGSFGPYAADLKAIESKLVNNGLIREERAGKMLRVHAGLTYEDARRAYARELQQWEGTLERIADLFLRMPTKDAEIAATIHFVNLSLAESLNRVPTEVEVLEEVMRWKARRRPPLNPGEVANTIRSLNMLGWGAMKPSSDLPVEERAVVGV
jgi:uncharacterized protein YwgA/O-acetyl-ADP-ribose deacetylase (regulator of RNase III)